MKKNKMMRAASGMLVATLVSTCAFSGAMAKYVVSDGVTDAARVAKFGVVVTASGDLFGTSYGGSTAVNTAAAAANTIQAWSLNKVNVSSVGADAANAALLVAPGTKNDKGMTFTVKGSPEVSTKLTIDVPETANKKYSNTDVKLLVGNYSIMVKVDPTKVVITPDNMTDFYRLNDTTKKFGALAAADFTDGALTDTTTPVYKEVKLIDGTSATMTAPYLPIRWTVKANGEDTNLIDGTTNTNDVAGVLNALKSGLSGDASGSAQKAPNASGDPAVAPWDATATVTWEWPFTTLDTSGTTPAFATGAGAWTDVSSDTTLPNWENTTLEDLEDTVLGQMINNALGTNTTASDYLVAKGEDLVQYAEIDAVKDTSANKVRVAYTGTTAPENLTDASVTACLTATFGARTTVEQTNIAQPASGSNP